MTLLNEYLFEWIFWILFWMNIFFNEYFGFCFELNFELNHFSARFNEKMNFQNVSNTPTAGSAAIKRWSQTSQMEQRVPFQCAGYFLKNLLHPPPCLPLPSLMNLQRPSSQGHEGLLITEYVESVLCLNGPGGHWDTESICWGPACLQIKTRPNRIQLQEGLRITAAARLKIVLLERKFTAKGWVCGLGPVSAAVLAATASIQLALLLSAGLLQSQR